MQRTDRRGSFAFDDLGGGDFHLVKNTVAVHVEAAIDGEATAKTCRVAFRDVAEGDQRIKAVYAIGAVGTVDAIVAFAGRQEYGGRQGSYHVSLFLHFFSPKGNRTFQSTESIVGAASAELVCSAYQIVSGCNCGRIGRRDTVLFARAQARIR